MGLKEQVNESLVIIDTDMGFDDIMAIAMLLAARAPILGITSVSGLAHARQGARNALNLLERAHRRDIPVAVGADAPLAGNHAFDREWRAEADVLNGIALPQSCLEPIPLSASEFLVRSAARHPKRITLLCLGPLTNIAHALQCGGPAFAQHIERIVAMGGAVRVPGNDTPNSVSEWNVYVDALAAAQTIHSGIPFSMIGLDVTNFARRTPALVNFLHSRTPGSSAGQIMQETIEHMYDYLYDPVAAAYLLDPSLIQTLTLPIQVVTEGSNIGQIVESSSGVPVQVAIGLDEQRFHQLLGALIDAV